MSQIGRFAAYAYAFEKAFEKDDWSLLEGYFTEDAVYEVTQDSPMGGRFEGRAAILAYFAKVVNSFDRRFASREISLLEGPKAEGDSVWIRGRAVYRADEVPELVIDLEETVHFAGDLIERMEDRYEPAIVESLSEYLAEHGEKLGIAI